MSAGRTFPIVAVRRADAGPLQSGSEIVCGACGAKDHVLNSNRDKAAPPEVIRRWFTDRGWTFGARPQDDRCPTCNAQARKKKGRILPDLSAADRTAKEPQMTEPAKPPVAPPPAEAPTFRVVEPAPAREMTRDDRRIILSKLQDVYVDEAVGYDRGWSDKRVAEDLGVPRAWVAELREPNFGPARDNEDVRALLAAQERVAQEAAEIKEATVALVERAAALAGEVAALRKTADAIRKAVC